MSPELFYYAVAEEDERIALVEFAVVSNEKFNVRTVPLDYVREVLHIKSEQIQASYVIKIMHQDSGETLGFYALRTNSEDIAISIKRCHMQDKTLVIVGGGRWGCVTLISLSKMEIPFNQIVIISKNNQAIVKELISELQPDSKIPLLMGSSLAEALTSYNVNAAIVVNAAPEHYETAKYLIENGVHVLVEKPITLTIEHMKHLIELALEYKVCLVPGLNYRFCRYLQNFAEVVAKRNEKPQIILLEWADAKNNHRHFNNRVTYTDPRTDIAQDLMSHVWVIFVIVFATNDIAITDCTLKGNYTEFSLLVNKTPAKVVIEQNAKDRKRKLSLVYAGDQEFILDFSLEPGIIKSDYKNVNADPEWDTQPRPLNQQYSRFFGLCIDGATTNYDIQACNDSTVFICHASTLLQEQKLIQN